MTHPSAKLGLAACLALTLVMSPVAGEASDFVIEPGKRAGPVTKGLTEDALKAMLPQGQVRRVLRGVGEGFYHCEAEIFAGTDNAAFVSWASFAKEYDEESEANVKECMDQPDLSRPVAVTIEGYIVDGRQRAWRTTRGIQIGNSIRKLERIGGGAFEFSICSCDGGGATNLDENPAFEGLTIRLDFPGDDVDVLEKLVPKRDLDFVSSSQVPNSMAHRFVVGTMVVSIAE
jgi:hypothetical protein